MRPIEISRVQIDYINRTDVFVFCRKPNVDNLIVCLFLIIAYCFNSLMRQLKTIIIDFPYLKERNTAAFPLSANTILRQTELLKVHFVLIPCKSRPIWDLGGISLCQKVSQPFNVFGWIHWCISAHKFAI